VNCPSHSAATLSQLQSVDWKGDFEDRLSHARSRAMLMREYLRRSACWAQELDATSKWPFFDIAALAAPQIEPPPELAEQLEALVQVQIGWPSQRTIARAALRWAAARDAGIPVPPELEDPYKPILLMLQRGGGWTTESNFIDLGGSSVVEKTWRDHLSNEPVTALDPAILNALDAQATS
jgi:hypothetical protein